MKLKDMPKEELEILSYNDLAYMLLKENKKKMNTPQIFKFICELLGYSDDEYTAKIGDFYTSLTTDKRFVLLDNVDWDLREHRKVELVIDDDDEEEIDIESEEEEIIEEDTEEEDLDANLDEDLEDDMDDLAIVDEEELDEDN
ncbi:MAG: DNA-directed RNA polymerase subunit delta [Bacilli bacterium]